MRCRGGGCGEHWQRPPESIIDIRQPFPPRFRLLWGPAALDIAVQLRVRVQWPDFFNCPGRLNFKLNIAALVMRAIKTPGCGDAQATAMIALDNTPSQHDSHWHGDFKFKLKKRYGDNTSVPLAASGVDLSPP